MSVKIIHPGLLTSIQDFGRNGYAKYGIPKSGVMDSYAAKIANLLVGNKQEDAVMEITMLGPILEFDKDALLVLVALKANVFLNDKNIELLKPFKVKSGDRLQIKQITSGVRLYLAISGGFQSELKLSSRSMYASVTNSSVIKKGDVIKTETYTGVKKLTNAQLKYDMEFYATKTLEVYPGPEFEELSIDLKTKLLEYTFHVSKNNSRMAYQLEETLENNLKPILTQPVLPGTVQFTPAGNIIILMRDAQTTGGYPRIFQLTKESINLLSQKRQGDKIEFTLKDY